MTDKWRTIAITDGKFDQQVNEVGEVSDCVVSLWQCDGDIVKHVLAFSKKLLMTCITPEAC